MSKIGLFGGTFDPPHHGHLILAEEALKSCDLDEVWFLPSFIPPHLDRKSPREMTSADHRIEMLSQCVGDNKRINLSLIEYERKGKSYTYNTLCELKDKFPNDQFYFIIGADMVNDLPKWYRFNDIKEMTQFLAVKRPGVKLDPPEGVHIHFFDMPLIDISSTLIREKIKKNQAWHYYLPQSVKKYIEENNLYEQS